MATAGVFVAVAAGIGLGAVAANQGVATPGGAVLGSVGVEGFTPDVPGTDLSVPGEEQIDDLSSKAEQAVNRRRRGAIGSLERRAGLTGGLLSNTSEGSNSLIQ